MKIQNFKPNYFIADGASMNTMVNDFAGHNTVPYSVYLGLEEEPIADVGPFLVNLKDNTGAVEWILTKGRGKHWGIFLNTEADFDSLLEHLQSLIVVEDEKGEELYFRFYDPRVIINFLPTCDTKQLKKFFGPVISFYAEIKDELKLMKFNLDGAKLKTDVIEFEKPENEVHESKKTDKESSENPKITKTIV